MAKFFTTIFIIIVCVFAFLCGSGYKFDEKTSYGKFFNKITSFVEKFVNKNEGFNCGSDDVKAVMSKILFNQKIENLPVGFNLQIKDVSTLSNGNSLKVCQANLKVDLSDELKKQMISDIDSGKTVKKIINELKKEGGMLGEMYGLYSSIGIATYLKMLRNTLATLDNSDDGGLFLKYQISQTDDKKKLYVKILDGLEEEAKGVTQLIALVALLSQQQ